MTSDLISKWIVEARKQAEMSQAKLGDELGVTKANVSAWETKRHDPSIQQLVKIVEATKQPAPKQLIELLSRSSLSAGKERSTITPAEHKLLEAYRSADDRGRSALLWIAEQAQRANQKAAVETADFAPKPKTAVNPDIPALKHE